MQTQDKSFKSQTGEKFFEQLSIVNAMSPLSMTAECSFY